MVRFLPRELFENPAVGVLPIALAFPITYFVYDYFKRSKYNFLSILGLISVLLTGGIGIFEIPTKWFALKKKPPSPPSLALLCSISEDSLAACPNSAFKSGDNGCP